MPVRSYATYTRAQIAARMAAGSLADAAVRTILRDLQREQARLLAQIASLPAGSPVTRARALEASLRIITTMHERLLVAATRAVTEQRRVGFEEIAAVWQEAALHTARVQGVPNALLGAIRQPPITLMGAYESLGGAASTWKTALKSAIDASGADLNLIVREGLAQQLHPEEIATRLRPYMSGAEPFHRAFPGEVVERVSDLRRSVPPSMREGARKMAYNARRIAYSEVHNARAEAEVTHFALDPLVAMIRWTLSPFRGQVSIPDVCDVLASANWYGLGPGLYPVGKVPVSPHPFDRSIAAWTPVLTSRGWRRVDEVRVDDEVWTHRGRWGRVTESLAGRVTAGWLELRTADGRLLTITDDHPVLLASGEWRLAGALRAGDTLVVSRDVPDDLVNPRLQAGALVTPASGPIEHDERPSSGGECVGLPPVLGSLPAGSVPAAVNLEGDAMLGNREVEVEAAEGVERDERDTGDSAARDDAALVLAEALVAEDRLGFLEQRRLSERQSSGLKVSREFGAPPTLHRWHPLPDEDVRFGDATPGDTPLDEPRTDGPAVDADALGDGVLADLLDGVPVHDLCTVELVDVRALQVSLRRWCLTVAKDKSFVAGGIVIHNCERMPVTRSVDDAARPKPSPSRLLAANRVRVPREFRGDMTAAQESRIVEQAERVMRASEQFALSGAMGQILAASQLDGGTLAALVSEHRLSIGEVATLVGTAGGR
jgi:hypothetical protein